MEKVSATRAVLLACIVFGVVKFARDIEMKLH